MPDYPLTPWHYGRAHGHLRAAGGTCSVRTAGQTLGTAQGPKAGHRVMTATDGGSRPRNCATLAIEVSGRYLFHSYSRSTLLGCSPKTVVKQADAAARSIPSFELALTVGQA